MRKPTDLRRLQPNMQAAEVANLERFINIASYVILLLVAASLTVMVYALYELIFVNDQTCVNFVARQLIPFFTKGASQ